MILLYIFAEWLDRKPNTPLLLSSPPLLTHVPMTRQKVRPFAVLPFHTEPIFPPHTPINTQSVFHSPRKIPAIDYPAPLEHLGAIHPDAFFRSAAQPIHETALEKPDIPSPQTFRSP